jgi:hypothetical protein
MRTKAAEVAGLLESVHQLQMHLPVFRNHRHHARLERRQDVLVRKRRELRELANVGHVRNCADGPKMQSQNVSTRR